MAAFLALLLYIVFVLVMTNNVAAQQQQSITVGSNLTTSVGSKWISPNGNFAFGLYNISSKLYLPGIWIDNIIDTTLVWTANADSPVEKGSTLQLSSTGITLQISNSQPKRILDTQDNLQGVVAAEMMNSGNLVLLTESNEIIWQSFDHPTDTLLPGQNLEPDGKMYSKTAETNYSRGRFELHLETGGDVLLSPVDRLFDKSVLISGTGHNNATLVFDDGGLYLNNSNSTHVLWNDSAGEFPRRVSLDTYGILKGYVWNGEDASWTAKYQAPIDINPCLVRGQCGVNAICFKENQTSYDCRCPSGFDFINNQNHFEGCVRNSSLQDCSHSKIEEIEDVNWPGNDYARLETNESYCKQACQEDSMCMLAIYGNPFCWKKSDPVIDGRKEMNAKAFIKICDAVKQRKRSKGLVAIIGISLGGCFTILAAVWLIIWFYGRLHYKPLETKQEQHKFHGGLEAFSYQEIDCATQGFKEEVGRGAFGKVYKGMLSDGRAIAVKKLDNPVKKEGAGGEKEFITELISIGTCHHRNLVQLYGFCKEDSHRILVYEFMSNGSLGSALFEGNTCLDWKLRFQVALGTARGILYLHEERRSPIIHCDIKPQNILLDENFNAKISDFGIAKLIGTEQTRTFTAARGTIGYIAPEWQKRIAITAKVDVYSFGVMMLEIICCRKIIAFDVGESQVVLSDWVYDCMIHGKLLNLVSEQDTASLDSQQLKRTVLVGLWCIQEDPSQRPSIKTVVQMLEGTVEIAVPPNPGDRGVMTSSSSSSSII